MMRAFGVLAVVASYGANAARVTTFDHKTRQFLSTNKPLVTQANAFESLEDACCACFKSKYAWPANAGRGASFAPSQTCDTCYATDIYDTGAKAKVVLDVAAPLPDGRKSGDCVDSCDTGAGCGYSALDGSTAFYSGAGACKSLVEDSNFVRDFLDGKDVCESGIVAEMCPAACGLCKGGAYEKTESKVMAVHEWNWNCASGNAPEDPAEWLAGPVEGEPSTRGSYLMCKESKGWYCPFDDGADLQLHAGAEEPEEVDDGGFEVPSVATMSLPAIEGLR